MPQIPGSTVWTSFIHFHSGTCFVYFTDMWHIREIQFRINSLCKHIHGKCHYIHISCTLSVSKQRTFYSVCTSKQTKFRICNATSTVIMWMLRKNYIFTIFHILTHVFNLTRIHMWHRQFYSYRQINDCLILRCWLPYIKNCITYFQCIFRFCSGKTSGLYSNWKFPSVSSASLSEAWHHRQQFSGSLLLIF